MNIRKTEITTEHGVDVSALIGELGKPSNLYEGYNAKNTLTVASGLTYPIDHIVELGTKAKQIEEERMRSKEAAKSSLGDITFGEIKEKVEVKKEKKMSKFELLQSLKK